MVKSTWKIEVLAATSLYFHQQLGIEGMQEEELIEMIRSLPPDKIAEVVA